VKTPTKAELFVGENTNKGGNDYLLVKTPTKAGNVVYEDTNHGAKNQFPIAHSIQTPLL
jgi:hypothetical protein